jgi:hypothetical protein
MSSSVASLVAESFACETEGDEQRVNMHIEITTDGGFTGRGIGNASVESDDHADVAEALANARPEDWRDEYRARGADLVHYTLTMEGRAVAWSTGATIPADLEALFEAVWNKR